jgi:hypothetical protein
VPTISLTDNFGLDVNIQPTAASSIARYFVDEVKLGFRDFDLQQFQNAPLSAIPGGPAGLGLTVKEPVAIGASELKLQLGGGAAASVAVLLARDNEALASSVFADPMTVAANEAYVAFSVTAKASAGVKATEGDAALGFTAGGEIEIKNLRRFADAAAPALPSIGSAVANFVLPRDAQDLAALAPSTVCTMTGSGSLKFSASFDLEFLTNPLATVALPLVATPIKITAGGSIRVSAAVTLSGEYQVRATKTGEATVRLGVYRQRARALNVSVAPSFGLSATFGSTDLIEKLLGAICSEPEVDKQALRAAGLDDASTKAVAATVEKGVQRRLEVAVGAGLTETAEASAAFLFDLSLDALDDAGRDAVRQALAGDFTAITGTALAGVAPVRSIHRTVNGSKHSLTLNLLGIFNAIGVSQLLVEGKAVYEEATGSLTLTDKVTASRIAAVANSAEEETARLRQLCAESFLITAAYRGGRTAVGAPSLTCSQSYFVRYQETNREQMRNMLAVAVALGAMQEGAVADRLGTADGYGATSVFAENRFDADLCRALFLNNGRARAQGEYEAAGRNAILLTVPNSPANEYRRRAVGYAVWQQLAASGNVAQFGSILSGWPPVQVEAVGSDYRAIAWWAESMARMAKVLETMEAYFAAHPEPAPNDPQFAALRQKLIDTGAGVAKNTHAHFGQPWGLIAMDQVLAPRSRARVQIVSGAFSLSAAR